MLLFIFIQGPGRGDRGDDETDFARPLSTKVPHTKRASSASSNISTGSVGKKPAFGLTKSASSGIALFDFFSSEI